jgi:glycolate oxidase FAD binding subunit
VSVATPIAETGSVLGARPQQVLEPATVSEAAEQLRALARDGRAVAFMGGGTDLELGAPPARLDALLQTRRLARVVEHAPSDQIVAVEAGMTLAELQRHLAPHGQRLAIDPPLPERATVGGIVAANAFGPLRTRFGTMRDLVIGIAVVRADGVLARGGGKVVKNVAGFDLPRLFCGSLGTLGLVAEVTFRLHPLPEASATVVVPALSAADVKALSLAVLDARLEPAAVAAFGDGERFRLALRFEGFAPGVRDQVDRLTGPVLAGRAPERLEGRDEAALWAVHDGLRRRGDVRAKATFAPASLERAAAALALLARALAGGAVILYPTVGVAFAGGDLQRVEDAAPAVEAARAAVRPAGGAVVLLAAPDPLRAAVDVWGPPPAALEVMRRLKRELDPDGRLSPGRFAGGI